MHRSLTGVPEVLFSGVGVALVTLFGPDGSVDLAATAAHADRLVGRGVQAVVVAGSTGEASTLTGAERVALLGAVRSAVAGRVAVLAGTGAPSARQAVALTRDAVAQGADGLLCLSPPGGADPRGYYGEVAAAAAGVPLFAYHFPRVSPPGIGVELLPELPVQGVKDSSGDPDRLLASSTRSAGRCTSGRRRCWRWPVRWAPPARSWRWRTSSRRSAPEPSAATRRRNAGWPKPTPPPATGHRTDSRR